MSNSPSLRTPGYKPGLAWFSTVSCIWVFVLVTLGAFTTSIGAGMIFPDWPLSDGSLNPHGWLSNIMMFSEHSHRLSATTMGILTIILAIWLWRRESRRWLRTLGWWAIGLVVLQGLLGGARVLLNPDHVSGIPMSIGHMLTIPHGILAQIYACLLIAIAVGLSRAWVKYPLPVRPGLRRVALVCCALLLLQLTIAATMRHSHAGLAIPTFPYSNAEGGWLPPAWDFRVALNFAHRAMALVLTVALLWFAIRIWTDKGASLLMRSGASLMIGLLALQILLGASVILLRRQPEVTTAHVVVGALLLVTTFWLTCLAHRDVIEAEAQPA